MGAWFASSLRTHKLAGSMLWELCTGSSHNNCAQVHLITIGARWLVKKGKRKKENKRKREKIEWSYKV